MELSRQMYMNPTSHSQQMTTWRVVGTQNILANSLRILNLKFNFDAAVYFKENVGVWGCVQRVRFLDLNGVEIDNFENVPQIMSLLLAMNDDETSKDITSVLYGTQRGLDRRMVPTFSVEDLNEDTDILTPVDTDILGLLRVGDVVTLQGTLNGIQVSVTRMIDEIDLEAGVFTLNAVVDENHEFTNISVQGYESIGKLQDELVDSTLRQLRLVRCLDFLRKSVTLNKGFTLVVEWDQNFNNWITQAQPADIPENYNLEPPVLAFEVYSKPLPNPKIVSYYTFRTNRVNLPAIAGALGQRQSVDLDLKGFKGLFIRRLLTINTSTNPNPGDAWRNTDDFGYFVSLAQNAETINFSLDGKTLMTYKGVFSSAIKSGYLNDLWGSVLGYQGGDKLVANTDAFASPHGTGGVGNRAYGCVEVDALINKEFILNYSRVNIDAARSIALTLHVVAECLKQYDEDNGLISYMLM